MWLPFILWSTALNAIFCVWVVGPSALSAVYREASTRDLALVCTFSFLCGSGTACFSLGIQLVSRNPPSCRGVFSSHSNPFSPSELSPPSREAEPLQLSISMHPKYCCTRGGVMRSSRFYPLPHPAQRVA